MSRPTKAILVIGIILIIYGYLCRILNIYFFWDSKTVGFILLFVALLSYWVDLGRKRKQQGKKIIWATVGVCGIIFGLVIFAFTIFMIKTSDAYNAAIEFLKTDAKIKAEIGKVNGFGLIPTGTVQTTTFNGAESGSATFEIIVKAYKKYKDVSINLKKTSDNFWTVTDVR